MAVILGGLNLMQYPTTREVPFWIAYPGIAVGIVYLLPEFLVSATIFFLFSCAVFLALPLESPGGRRNWLWESVIAYLGLSLGVALEFPAVLNNALFTPLRNMSLLLAYVSVALLLIGLALFRHGLRQPRRRLGRALAPVVIFVAAGWLLPWLRESPPPRYWYKFVAALEGIVLTVVIADMLPGPGNVALLTLALVLLGGSFGHEVRWLWQNCRIQPRRLARPRRIVLVTAEARAAIGVCE